MKTILTAVSLLILASPLVAAKQLPPTPSEVGIGTLFRHPKFGWLEIVKLDTDGNHFWARNWYAQWLVSPNT
jgi:hypothetical protein